MPVKYHVNPYAAVLAFGSFAGKAMGTLDAINALNNQDKHDLHRIMMRIAGNAGKIAEQHKSEDVRADAQKVSDAFLRYAKEYLL